MKTPIFDFVSEYSEKNISRLHMPGHKGAGGIEKYDITEVSGADALYEAAGIIAESEKNASAIFGTMGSFYSTEGSSQCIKAMLYLALCCKKPGCSDKIAALRNVHRSFIHACALLDIEPVWLYPKDNTSLCACKISPAELEKALAELDMPPAAVYVTSPDYLGNMADVAAFAIICHRHGTRLIADNAHGAYLHFLPEPLHPIDLGADLCCDSAHKTLPVLTGGAYLHIRDDEELCARAKQALSLFGSTSPSYLILSSLDRCNAYLDDDYKRSLSETVSRIDALKARLAEMGWTVLDSDPLKLTVHSSLNGISGAELAAKLRASSAEPEFADRDYLVLMLTPANPELDYIRIEKALGRAPEKTKSSEALPACRPERVFSPREAIFCPQETAAVSQALGRICGSPTVACPPAVPVCAAGERIDGAAIEIFRYYGIDFVDVIKEERV